MTVNLNEVRPGQQGLVERVNGTGQIFKRLLEMGVTPGAHIEMRRLAPLGDPMELRLRGYHLTLRKEEAAKIAVTLL